MEEYHSILIGYRTIQRYVIFLKNAQSRIIGLKVCLKNKKISPYFTQGEMGTKTVLRYSVYSFRIEYIFRINIRVLCVGGKFIVK